jgi:hypothetical protein
MIAEELLKYNPGAVRVLFNKFGSAISFKPTVSTVMSPEVGGRSSSTRSVVDVAALRRVCVCAWARSVVCAHEAGTVGVKCVFQCVGHLSRRIKYSVCCVPGTRAPTLTATLACPHAPPTHSFIHSFIHSVRYRSHR